MTSRSARGAAPETIPFGRDIPGTAARAPSRSAADGRRCAALSLVGPRALRRIGWGLLAGVLAGSPPAAAQPGSAAASGDVGELLGRPIPIVLLLVVLSMLPFAFMTLTAFIKISTVLQIVRGAIGAQNIPSSTVVMALSTALTVVAMAPLGSRIVQRVMPVLTAKAGNTAELVTGLAKAGGDPLRGFLGANATEREKARFFALAKRSRPESEREQVAREDLVVVIPAFIVTELMEAFALGFAVYLPLLVIDLVVANVLLALGMQMMNPVQVSLPFKLLLFVAVDGWGLLAQALVTGYRLP
ncbi:EscR/YscR/HrcR family type III secretion system export apparatus protein [Myxococcota bacterium]